MSSEENSSVLFSHFFLFHNIIYVAVPVGFLSIFIFCHCRQEQKKRNVLVNELQSLNFDLEESQGKEDNRPKCRWLSCYLAVLIAKNRKQITFVALIRAKLTSYCSNKNSKQKLVICKIKQLFNTAAICLPWPYTEEHMFDRRSLGDQSGEP